MDQLNGQAIPHSARTEEDSNQIRAAITSIYAVRYDNAILANVLFVLLPLSSTSKGDTMQENTLSTSPKPLHQRKSLFHYTAHPHKPQNVNLLFEAEKAAGNVNQKVAVGLTGIFQAMPTFWLIMGWIVIWIIANATIVHFDPLPWPLLLTLASVPQLPLMIVIMVGQGLLGRKQELQSEEQYNTTMKTYHDIEQIMAHLAAQDTEILRQTHMITHLLQQAGIPPDQFLDTSAPTPLQTAADPVATSNSTPAATAN